MKLVKPSILPTLFVHFVRGRLRELESRYLWRVIVWVRVVSRKTAVGEWRFVDSEDDYCSGSQNVSHQQQSFWRLPLPGRSHKTNICFVLFCFVFLCQIQVLPDPSVDNLVLIECFPSEGTGYLCGVTFNAVDLWITFTLAFNPFTPKSQLQFSLSVSHQRYIIQYGELGIW